MEYKIFEKYLQKTVKNEGPFRLKDLPDCPENFEQFLEESGLFFWTFDNWGSRQYLRKEHFFDESTFSIHLSSAEIKYKFLCAPARFLPFTSNILPLKLNGKSVEIVRRKPGIRCLEAVYSLDKGLNFITTLQQIENRDFLNLKAAAHYEIPVYDLSQFELVPGDHIRLTLKKNVLEAHVFNSEEINISAVSNWCSLMEKTICGILDEFGPTTDIITQLEQAYFYGPELLRKNQSPAIRDFIKLSRKLKVTDFVFRKIIWYSGKSPATSKQVQKEKLQVVQELQRPSISQGYASFLDESMLDNFRVEEAEFAQYAFQATSDLEDKIAHKVKTLSLWILNNRDSFYSENLPVEEMLMFYVSFCELQRICDLYRNEGRLTDDLLEAFKLNSEILNDLMEFLQACIISM